MRIAVVGATGHTGRMVVRLLRRSHAVVACARRRGPLERLRAEASDVQTLCLFEATPDGAAEMIASRGVDVVVQCAPLRAPLAARLARGCAARGVHYLDVTAEAAVASAVYEMADVPGRQRGVIVSCGLGPVGGVLGTTLASLVAGRGHAVELTYVATGFATAAGSRSSALRILLARRPCVPRRVDFPPPFWPGMALRVPFADAWLLERFHGVASARTRAAVTGGSFTGEPERARDERVPFGIVARAHAHGTQTDEVAITGTAPYDLTAQLVALGIACIVARPQGAAAGFMAPSILMSPARVVDHLADSPLLRWFRATSSAVAA